MNFKEDASGIGTEGAVKGARRTARIGKWREGLAAGSVSVIANR
jgi:hypothetical protein